MKHKIKKIIKSYSKLKAASSFAKKMFNLFIYVSNLANIDFFLCC